MELLNEKENEQTLDMEELKDIVINGDNEETDEPTFNEAKEIILNCKNGKAPGKGGINLELIKYGGEKIQRELYELIKEIWKIETIPNIPSIE